MGEGVHTGLTLDRVAIARERVAISIVEVEWVVVTADGSGSTGLDRQTLRAQISPVQSYSFFQALLDISSEVLVTLPLILGQ
jgi:hypothetical protein